jgi:hypothetical protein
MTNLQFQKALRLVKKTGKGMIIMDEGTDSAFVLTSIEEYESEAINSRPIATSPKQPGIWDVMPEAGEEGETWDMNDLSVEEKGDLERQYKAFVEKNSQETEVTSEIQTEKKDEKKAMNDEDFGEEEFYLEPVD